MFFTEHRIIFSTNIGVISGNFRAGFRRIPFAFSLRMFAFIGSRNFRANFGRRFFAVVRIFLSANIGAISGHFRTRLVARIYKPFAAVSEIVAVGDFGIELGNPKDFALVEHFDRASFEDFYRDNCVILFSSFCFVFPT